MDCSTPGLPVHHQLPELTQIYVHLVGDVVQPSHPLSFPSPPAFNLFQHQGLFQWVCSSNQVATCIAASASASVLPMNISFRINLFDLFAVQGTLKSLLQHHSSKVLIIGLSAFLTVQLSNCHANLIMRNLWIGPVRSSPTHSHTPCISLVNVPDLA